MRHIESIYDVKVHHLSQQTEAAASSTRHSPFSEILHTSTKMPHLYQKFPSKIKDLTEDNRHTDHVPLHVQNHSSNIPVRVSVSNYSPWIVGL